MSRSELLIAKIKKHAPDASREIILEELNGVQLELCEKYYAKRGRINFALTAGRGIYPIVQVSTTDGQSYEGRTEEVGTSAVQLGLNRLEGEVYLRSRADNTGRICLSNSSDVTIGGANSVLLMPGEYYPYRVDQLMVIYAVSDKVGQVLELVPSSMCKVNAVNVHKIAEVFKPSSWVKGIEFTYNPQVWNRWREEYAIGPQPLKGFIWNGEMHITPAPSEDIVLVMLIYELPQNDIKDFGEPELDRRWEDCLEWGTIARLTGDERYERKYLMRAIELSRNFMSEGILGVHVTESVFERLGW